MKLWIGYFGSSGSPVLKVRVSGPFTEGKDYEAILDTGFTGFLSIPLLQAISLGLILHGTTTISLADGSTAYRLTARGKITVEGEEKVGVVILEPTSTELLLGMGFLRQFKKAVIVSEFGVALASEDDVRKFIPTEPSPPTLGNSKNPPTRI
jgi:predicted aspartyl protease